MKEDGTKLQVNCTLAMVLKALQKRSSTNSNPDEISFRLLKFVAKYIITPLCIICQGIFPRAWKHSTTIPLYKGKGNKDEAENYRPINHCSCPSKILEDIFSMRLCKNLPDNKLLHHAQYGFVPGRSTLTNFLFTDSHIAKTWLQSAPSTLSSSILLQLSIKLSTQQLSKSPLSMISVE